MVTTAPSRFRHARFYITFRCNARCGYCNVWQDPVFFGHDELGPDDLRRCLDQIRELGVEYVDFTGGEPGLHHHLAVAVRHARQIGLRTEVTTNAIRFARQADDVVPYVDNLNISMDTVSAERYHAIRGVDTLDRTVALIERLRSRDAASLKLIAVVTSQTIVGLDDIIGFAQANEIPVYLSPMFEYFDGQAEYRDPARTMRVLRLMNGQETPRRHLGQRAPEPGPGHCQGDMTGLLSAIRARSHAPYTIVNLDFLRHVETLDPSAPTACGAGSRILTIGPDGRLLLPCYHQWDSSLHWDRHYLSLVEDPAFIRIRDTEVGRLPGCRSCAVFPYIGLASSYRLTADFLVQAVSTEISKLKTCVQALHTPWPDETGLAGLTDRLLARLAGLSLRPGTHPDELYYFSAVAGRGAVTDLAPAPVAVEEILADHVHEDCWRVQRTPHRITRQLYASIVPALVMLAGDGHGEARELALASLRAHLRMWEAWLNLFPARAPAPPTVGTPTDAPAEAQAPTHAGAPTGALADAPAGTLAGPARWGHDELAGWCLRAGDVLAASGRAEAARSLAALALLTDIPPARLLRWGGVAGHAEELFLAKVVATGLTPARRAALAPCFSSPLASLLASRGMPAGPGMPAGADVSARPYVPAGGEQPAGQLRPSSREAPADVARAARGDPAELARLCALGRHHCWVGNTMALRKLVRAWKVATGADPGRLERMLLAAELRVPADPRAAR